jgi:uncharacterized protein YdhG (YjbR/CyaY superfamily)
MAAEKQAGSIDEYIAAFPADVQQRLEAVRQTIHEMVADATETVSYQIPTFKLDGRYLIYFAGYKHHLGVYPVPTGTDEFESVVGPYRASKATIRFAHREPFPLDVLRQIVVFLTAESTRRASKQK